MPKVKSIKEAYRQQSINKNKLIEVAKSNAITELLDIIDVNYSVIDVEGNYITQNNAMIADVSKGNIKAQLIDPVSWEDCQKVMESRTRKVVEEQFEGRYYLSVKQPVLSDDECIGIIVLSFDVTERKQAEKAKIEFLENMSHDLRTPFSGLLSITEYLCTSEKDQSRKEMLGMAVHSARRLLQLLNQVLEMTRAGDHPLTISEVDLKEAVAEVAELLEAEVKAKGLSFTVQCPDGLIKTDRMRFNRILLNLIGNAVKFTEQGSVELSVKVDKQLSIVVKDTGVGIPEDKLDVIFEKFTKVTPSYKQQSFKGSGIGLSIVKQFVNDLGGSIAVTSALEHGSVFTVYLPLCA